MGLYSFTLFFFLVNGIFFINKTQPNSVVNIIQMEKRKNGRKKLEALAKLLGLTKQEEKSDTMIVELGKLTVHNRSALSAVFKYQVSGRRPWVLDQI